MDYIRCPVCNNQSAYVVNDANPPVRFCYVCKTVVEHNDDDSTGSYSHMTFMERFEEIKVEWDTFVKKLGIDCQTEYDVFQEDDGAWYSVYWYMTLNGVAAPRVKTSYNDRGWQIDDGDDAQERVAKGVVETLCEMIIYLWGVHLQLREDDEKSVSIAILSDKHVK